MGSNEVSGRAYVNPDLPDITLLGSGSSPPYITHRTEGMVLSKASSCAFDMDDTRRVAVLTSASDDAFSSGADVTDMPELWRCIPGIGVQTDKPIISAVSGWCIGGGLAIAMMSDLIVASESAKFYYPEPKVGYTGGLIAGLVTRLPYHAAMEVIMPHSPLEKTVRIKHQFDRVEASHDRQEGIAAFREKRKPEFLGK